MSYNYKEGKDRVEEYLDDYLEIEEVDDIPNDKSFTFSNAYKSWVTAIFVDIRNSTELFNSVNKEDVAKIIRSFTSEIIDILEDENIDEYPEELFEAEEIGIRGNCVYAIYSGRYPFQDYEVYMRACYINTLIKMLNNLLNARGLNSIDAGIGISTAKEVIIKAGRRYANVNHKVWIGNAVTKASKLSSLGRKNGIERIVVSKRFYDSIMETKKKKNKDSDAKKWFTECKNSELGTYYHADIIINDFNNWIKEGMK